MSFNDSWANLEQRYTSKGKLVHKPIYNRRGWVLGECSRCGRLNYVEPHGTTAECRCSPDWWNK